MWPSGPLSISIEAASATNQLFPLPVFSGTATYNRKLKPSYCTGKGLKDTLTKDMHWTVVLGNIGDTK